MRVEPLGESALILRELPCDAPAAAAALGGLPGVVEAWAAFDAVGLVFDRPLEEASLDDALRRGPVREERVHSIPVVYDGEDLAEVARRTGLSESAVVGLHAREYVCGAVGFCPGFAYLGPLAPELALPRRDAPRSRVAPGSVALAAGMTAVYPLERPGGWWLVGRTPLVLVDEEAGYFPIRAGDRVRFVPIGAREYAERMGDRL